MLVAPTTCNTARLMLRGPTPEDAEAIFAARPSSLRAASRGDRLHPFAPAGGGEEDENKISLCAVHHLQCVHKGWVRVTGKAPDQLRWQLGVRPGRPPLLDVVSTPEGYLAVRRAGDDESATSAPAGAAATGFASPEASSLS